MLTTDKRRRHRFKRERLPKVTCSYLHKNTMSAEHQVSQVLSCNTCYLRFNTNAEMREHYKTNFHRFNLKRKGAGLRPVPQDLFDKKVAELQAPQTVAKGDQHIKDSKKRAKGSKAESEMELEQAPVQEAKTVKPKTDEELIDEKIASAVKLRLTQSLFDTHESKSMEQNIEYMTKNFSFFFPYIDYLKDIEGLLTYLGQKLSIGHTCLYCDKSFYSLGSVRDHMRCKSHTMMQWNYKEEYEEFYEFPQKTFADNIDEEGNLQDTDSIYVQPKTGQLVLADNSRVVGHRAYKVYYNQRQRSDAHLQLMTSLLQEHKRMAMIQHQKAVNTDHRYQQRQQHNSLRVGLIHNNQKHFREANPLV